MITLRPYQEAIIEQVREQLIDHRAVLVCAPCGSGKGSLIAYMVHGAVKRGKRVIFAVHGRALVQDMSERVTRLGIEHGVLMGGHKRERWHPVQVASIDTLHRMKHRPKCDLIILDEARTFMSATGRMVIDDYPEAKVVGADATPLRLDGKGLGVDAGGIFEAIVMGPNEQDLIDMGYLVPSIPIGIENPPDVSKVKIVGGEFNNKQLAAACKNATRVGDIVEHWKREAYGLKTVAFGIDQADARDITEQFMKAGISWAYVDANTPDAERQEIWDALDHGDLMGFSNVGIAGCGWDHPIVSSVILGAATASLSKLRQQIGRGSRPYTYKDGRKKEKFVILDHAGCLIQHFPYGFFETPPVWSLDGKITKPGKDDDAAPRVATCRIPVPVPETGVPVTFKGPVSEDKRWMLPSFHTFKAGPSECPYCGLPLVFQGRKVEVEHGQLTDLSAKREEARAEVKVQSDAQIARENKMRERYLELAMIGATKRKADGTPYSPKWPAVAFNHEFRGIWPKKAWKDEAAARIAALSNEFTEGART